MGINQLPPNIGQKEDDYFEIMKQKFKVEVENMGFTDIQV